MNRSRLLTVGVLVLATVLLSGCSLFVTHCSIGVDSADVATIELYEYEWGTEPETVGKVTIEANREIVETWVSSFTDMPTMRVSSSVAEDVQGKESLGVRFALKDGTTREVTRIFINYHDVVVICSDGSVRHAEWGAPDLLDHDSQFGILEEVDADERPRAELP